MIYVIYLALAGGLFSILGFIHFVTDWVFQSHAEAMVKHANAKVRAKHCAIYTLGFVPLLIFIVCVGALTWWQFVACIAILFLSHLFASLSLGQMDSSSAGNDRAHQATDQY